jgi:NADH:ubiquinone oxidoreductase subunit K
MKNFAFTKINYILIAVSVVLIITGFALMAGSSTTTEFNPDVFSFRRITVAPIVCMTGFFGMIIAIMYKKR